MFEGPILKRVILPEPKVGYPPVGAPPRDEEPTGGPDGSRTAIGPLLEPAPIVVERDEDEPVEGVGPAVAAALAEVEPTDGAVVTPAPPAAPPDVEVLPPGDAAPAEPLDLLDTSTAPWLRDPELGVAWRESWAASASEAAHAHPGPEEPAVEPPAPAEPVAPPQAATEPPPAPPRPEPPPARPARRELPEIHFLSNGAPPKPPTNGAAPPASEPAEPAAEPEPTPAVLPPRTYRPRSLERLLDAGPPAGHERTWAPPLTYAPRIPPPPEPPRPVPPPPSPAKRAEAALRDAREGAAVVEVVSRPWRKPTSAEWGIAAIVGIVVGLVGAGVAWAMGPGRTDVVLEKYRVPVPQLAPALEGLRIAHVSDLMVPGSADVARSAAALVARERPDVVVLTGDLLDGSGPRGLAALTPLLPSLRGRLATVAVAGEHDLAGGLTHAQLAAALSAQGVTLLDGARHDVAVRGATLALLGAAGDSASVAGLQQSGPRAFTVWLTHAPGWLATPASKPLHDDAALLLAGHTRGGQVRVPFTGGLRPEGSGPYVGGFYQVGSATLHVSRGIGTEGMRARLLSPPSVTLLTLAKGTVAGEAPVAER